MDFSEFRRKLGAEPRSDDPELLAARESSGAHRELAAESDRFEAKLEGACALPVPDDLVDGLCAIPGAAPRRRIAWPVALAASLLIAVGAVGIGWQVSREPLTVEDYVMSHYRHDGERMVAQSMEAGYGDVHELLAEFGLDAEPALADAIRLVKRCPTPGGDGVHMVVHTANGPLTIIYMPDTAVTDHATLAFDDQVAVLVQLERGSAAIIGAGRAPVELFYAVVHDGIVPLAGRS
jgi:hypothetical protein